jgi:hypothetical protein
MSMAQIKTYEDEEYKHSRVTQPLSEWIQSEGVRLPSLAAHRSAPL